MSKILALFTTLLLLSSCGIIPGQQALPTGPTAVPTATPDAAGYIAVPTQACLISDWTAMQTNKPQGDLIAWQPGTHDIAYMAPADRSSWFVGDLLLAKAPDYQEHLPLATGILVTGDLTWSPSGKRLAFLAFRPNENVYTVMTVQADGSELTDLFPTDLARTDVRTSQKAIIDWKDDDTVEVISSCGEECRNAYDIRFSGPTGPVLTPTPLADYTDLTNNLQLHRKEIQYTPAAFPRTFGLPHWSPDQRWVAYLDKRLLLWVLSPEQKITFPIDIGLRDVAETQWASDSHALAVRAEDRIFVFDIHCKQ